MRNHLIANTCLISVASFFAHTAKAAEIEDTSSPPPLWQSEIEIGATFASDNMFRGQSGSDSKPGATVHAFGLYGPLYVGALWFNKYIAPDDPTTAEADFLIGIMPQLGPLRFDFAAVYSHLIPDNSSDYWEFKAGVGMDLPFGISGALNYYYAPDYVLPNIKENVYELTWSKQINPKWSISGSTGHLSFSQNYLFKSYNYWDAGVSYNIAPSLKLDLHYYDTDLKDGQDCISGTCDNRVVLAVSWSSTLSELLK